MFHFNGEGILGASDIPSNMKAGWGGAGFSVSPGSGCNHQTQCSNSSALKHLKLPLSLRRGTHQRGLGGLPSLLSVGETL